MSDTNRSPKKHRKTGRIIKRIIKWIVLLAVLAAGGLFGFKAYIQKQAESKEKIESYAAARVRRGAMEETVYGTGTTSAANQPSILAQADGTLTSLRVSVGDTVKQGDILAVLTNEEIDSTITDLEFALWDLDDTILGTGAGARVDEIEAPAAGRVVAVYAGEGDDALAVFRREGALAIISTDGRMKVELSDVTADVSLNDTLLVEGETFSAYGNVVDVTRHGTAVTLTIQDDSLPLGEHVSVIADDGTVVGESELAVNKPMAVSSYGGTISKVYAEVGKTFKRSQVLFRLDDSPITLKLENLRLQREAAAKELEEAKAQRENLILVAPCDGVVATLEAAEGDEITSGMLMGSLLEGEDMNLTIAVDELDVVSVKAGQKVAVTVDALPGVALTGEVLKIAPVGASGSGVTTYDVELAMDTAGSGVRSGMNATGEIVVAANADTLYVPVEALMTIGNEQFVLLQSGNVPALEAGNGRYAQNADVGMQRGMQREMNGSAEKSEKDMLQEEPKKTLVSAVRNWLYEGVQNEAEQPSGVLTKVQVGMQNDDYAEILSGVSEGDVVLYTRSGNTNSYSMNGMNMMMGGMPAGSAARTGTRSSSGK